VIAFTHCSWSANDNGIAVEQLARAGVVAPREHRFHHNITVAVATEHSHDVISEGDKEHDAKENEQPDL
jgi:metallophosphoesterase superfamily enzyme